MPTINQIIRRKRQSSRLGKISKSKCTWEYDYITGRSVPGDGRIDFDKSFPPENVDYTEVRLGYCLHAKQMCDPEKGGALDKVWKEVVEQIKLYDANIKEEGTKKAIVTAKESKSRFLSKIIPFKRKGIQKIQTKRRWKIHMRNNIIPLKLTRYRRKPSKIGKKVVIENISRKRSIKKLWSRRRMNLGRRN